jgi:two-component system sensor kinase
VEIKRTKKPVVMEHIHIDSNGQSRNIEVHGFPVLDQSGNLSQMIEYGIDITERKRTEEELNKHRKHLEELIKERTRELNERIMESEQLNKAMTNIMEDMQAINRNLRRTTENLKDANKELESFSYSVSHDLRAPLRAIDGFSKILLEDYADKLDKDGKRKLNVIREGIETMSQLINDLLKFSRLGRQSMSISNVNMEKLAKAAFKDMENTATGRKVNFELKMSETVSGDRAMLHQVLVNLFSNALKFTGNRNTSVIKAGSRVKKNGENVFYVKDNGVGFDMRYVDKVFTVFQRLHSKEEFEGTGVGLALVQRIINRHGGRVWAEGKVNEGTTIYFALPKA